MTNKPRTPGRSTAFTPATMEVTWPRSWSGLAMKRAATLGCSTASINSVSFGRPITRTSSTPPARIDATMRFKNVSAGDGPHGKRAFERPIRLERPAANTTPGTKGTSQILLGPGLGRLGTRGHSGHCCGLGLGACLLTGVRKTSAISHLFNCGHPACAEKDTRERREGTLETRFSVQGIAKGPRFS